MVLPSVEIPVLTVSSLTHSIKTVLEGQFRFFAVQGEVSNAKLQTSGHFYFSLKDHEAQISAVMFKSDVQQLGKLPKEGDQVIVKGSLNVYPPSGKYQIVARSIELSGLGALLLQLEKLKARLQEKGYFDPAHKQHLPKFPQKIGVVTSPTGAVIQDILNVLTRRFAGFQLILNPVKVQGPGAADEIAKAIDDFNRYGLADVLIVGRGGGSIEDLWAFNEEKVAEAIYRSKIPIISAVGHESDYTIADMVADVRAPTPSAAAEMVIAEKTQQIKWLEHTDKVIRNTVIHLIRHDRQWLNSVAKHPLFLNPRTFFHLKEQKLDEIQEELDRGVRDFLRVKKTEVIHYQKDLQTLNPVNRLRQICQKMAFLLKSIDQSVKHKIQKEHKHLDKVLSLLHALDPRNVLEKGYAILFSEKTGSIIQSIESLSKGESVILRLADGTATSTINEINTSESVKK